MKKYSCEREISTYLKYRKIQHELTEIITFAVIIEKFNNNKYINAN